MRDKKMNIPEQFLQDNPDIVKKPYNLFKEYSSWLQLSYRTCPSEEGRRKLQKEADRFSDIYCKTVRELFN